MRSDPIIRFVLAGMAALIAPMYAAAAQPKFEVASVKRCIDPPAGEGEGRGPQPESPDRIAIRCWNLSALINAAYVVFAGGRFNGNYDPITIGHLPGWGSSENYTIKAKAEGTPGQFVMRGPMLQALLEDRFALKIHSETRSEPAYALTVRKGGFKLQPSRGVCTPFDPVHPPASPVQDLCPHTAQDSVMSLDIFAWFLGNVKPRILDAPVINKTGIAGFFHFNMEALLMPSDVPAGPPAVAALTTSVFTAVNDLGLKLHAIKAPRQYLVVDHVERPSEN